MGKLKEQFELFHRALATLEEAVSLPFSVIVRDASIQRFEYTFELLWKVLKSYLKEQEGIVCNSPKRCIRAAFEIGLISPNDIELFLQMADDRNLVSHTYIEAIAEDIYQKIPTYLSKMKMLLASIQSNL